jgi:hypothetical protein
MDSKRKRDDKQDDSLKQCTKCKESKPMTDFGKHKKSKGGVDSRCKVCIAAATPKCVQCNKVSSFGLQQRKPTHCKEHALPDMRDVIHPKCQKCRKRPCVGFQIGQATHCKEHGLPGMSNVVSRRCRSCSKFPAFGFESGKPIYCKDHKVRSFYSAVQI